MPLVPRSLLQLSGRASELVTRSKTKSKGWRSGDSARLPPMWPGTNSRRRRHGLSLLLVLSLAPRGFSPGTPVFPSPQKPTLPNSNSIWNARTRLHQFIWTPRCFVGKQAIYNFFLESPAIDSQVSLVADWINIIHSIKIAWCHSTHYFASCIKWLLQKNILTPQKGVTATFLTILTVKM